MFSKFVHIVAFIRISVFFKAEKYPVVCMYHILFVHVSMDTGFSLPLAGVNNAAMNIVVHI